MNEFEFSEIAFDKFIKENPTADSLEIAKHFFELGRNYEVEYQKAQKELEDKLPKYYGE